MEMRRMGHSGLKLSALSLGSWVTFGSQFGVDSAVEIMKAAYDAGVNFFDNAEAYAMGEAEVLMGEAFRKLGWRRGSYVVSTKFYWGLHDSPNEKNTLNRKRLMDAIDGSLHRFKLDEIDLVYCHRDEVETPVGEIVWAMSDMITAGKAHYWGTSEWTADRIVEATNFAREYRLHAPIVVQPNYNLLTRTRFEQEYRPVFDTLKNGATTFSPLASGILSGKYLDGIPEESRLSLPNMSWLHDGLEEKLAKVKSLKAVADELGCTLSQLSIAWCLKNPDVTSVITGASKLSQWEENLGALAVVGRLDDPIMQRIHSLV
ncbi:MAG TPA: aldo/keto reductase [Fimbriimonadaceae bacterium]|nr:aldo/keto reductase [Fimbriimonadaceae bacterium]